MKKELLIILGFLLATSNLACFSQNKGYQYGLINSSGEVIIPFKFDTMRQSAKYANAPTCYIWVSKNGFEGFMDTNGNTLVPCEYDYISSVSDNVAIVKLDNKYGSVDMTKGKLVIPCIYYSIGDFHDGLAKVYKSGKIGFIDKTGKIIALGIYDDIEDFHNGYAKVEKDGKWGFVDKEGKEIIPCINNISEIDYIGPFNDNGIAMIRKKNNPSKSGFINTKGEEVIPCIYDEVECIYDNTFKNTAIAVKKDEKWGFLNAKGEEIIKPKYNYVNCSLSKHLDFCFFNVKINGKYGCVNAQGKDVLPCEYDEEIRYVGGHCFDVYKDNKHSIYNMELKKFISPFIYDYVNRYNEGYFQVEKNGIWNYIDSKGDEYQYKYKGNNRIINNQQGKNKKYGLVDVNGNQIVDFIYNFIEYAYNDVYIVWKEGKAGLINGKGQIIVPTIYKEINHCRWKGAEGTFIVKKTIQ